MAGTQVPFPMIVDPAHTPGGWKDVQYELWQDFTALQKQVGGSFKSGYDAFVDPGLAADNVSTKTFKTVYAAVFYCQATLGLTVMHIGVTPSFTAITETAAYPGAVGGLSVTLEVMGPANGPAGVVGVGVWNLASFTTNTSKINTWILSGMVVSGWSNAELFRVAYARNCTFNWTTTGALGCSGDTMLDHCLLQGAPFYQNSASVATLWLMGCNVQINGNCTFGSGVGTLFATDTTWAIIASSTLTVTLSFRQIHIDGVGACDPSSFRGGFSINNSCVSLDYNIGSAAHAEGFTTTRYPTLVVVAGSSLVNCRIQGSSDRLTVQAQTSAAYRGAQIAMEVNDCDITGPANLNLTGVSGALTPSRVLRGTGFSGSVNVQTVASSTQTLLALIGVIQSSLNVSLGGGTAGNKTVTQGYTIDAASGGNVLMLEQAAFGIASTNASTTTAIIDHTGIVGGTVFTPHAEAASVTPTGTRSITTLQPTAPTAIPTDPLSVTIVKASASTKLIVDLSTTFVMVASGSSPGPFLYVHCNGVDTLIAKFPNPSLSTRYFIGGKVVLTGLAAGTYVVDIRGNIDSAYTAFSPAITFFTDDHYSLSVTETL